MTAEEITRDQAMEARVGRTLEDEGWPVADIGRVRAAHRLAMTPRIERLVDPHHPDFLHPGRTVLILILDAGFRDLAGLAAAALVESEREDLRVDRSVIRDALGPEVADWVAAVPLDPEGLAEALVTAGKGVRTVALAERLDHCRHAKFWPDREARVRILEQAETTFGPVAERTDPALARRFVRWSGAFVRTLRREAEQALRLPRIS